MSKRRLFWTGSGTDWQRSCLTRDVSVAVLVRFLVGDANGTLADGGHAPLADNSGRMPQTSVSASARSRLALAPRYSAPGAGNAPKGRTS
jgi:hypothetical protein